MLVRTVIYLSGQSMNLHAVVGELIALEVDFADLPSAEKRLRHDLVCGHRGFGDGAEFVPR